MNYFSALLVVLGIELLALLALLGDRRFALHERIPVRWSKDSRPSLYIKRRVGLAVFPVVGTVVLLGLALGRQPVYVLAVSLLALAGGNMLYFRAIDRTMQEA